MADAIELSVVVLSYMAEETLTDFINQLYKELKELDIVFEIITVANYYEANKDATPKIAYQLAEKYPEIVVVSVPKQGKMGWDMNTGLKASAGKFIAVIDGDGQMPCSDIPIVYKIIATGDFDLVKTFRIKRFDGLYRSLLSGAYNFLFSLLYKTDFPVKDINSKPKIISRESFLRMNLKSNDWFTDAEIMLEANLLKLRVCQVATVFYRNERRKSFVKVGTIFEFVFNLFKYKALY